MIAKEVINSLRGRDYKLGGFDMGGPLDCFGLVREFLYKTNSIDLLDSLESKVVETYPERYLELGSVVIKDLIELISITLEEICGGYNVIGDVICTETQDEKKGVGIYSGNNYILCVHQRYGTFFSRLSDYERFIGYRCHKQSQ